MRSKSLFSRLDKIKLWIAPGNPVLYFDFRENGDIYLYQNGESKLINYAEYARLSEGCDVVIVDDIP